jgi:AbrB family looped-hinge helix DNA binding protein
MPRVSEKGQVTIPKNVREILGIHPGDEVEFEKENGDIKIIKKVDDKVLDDFVGYLGKGKSDKVIRELRGESD